MRRLVRLVLRLGVVAGAGYAVMRTLQRRVDRVTPIPGPSWPPVTPPTQRPAPQPEPRPEPSAAPVAADPPPPSAPTAEDGRAWVEPSSDGLCPQSHPIRA